MDVSWLASGKTGAGSWILVVDFFLVLVLASGGLAWAQGTRSCKVVGFADFGDLPCRSETARADRAKR